MFEDCNKEIQQIESDDSLSKLDNVEKESIENELEFITK